MSQSTDAQICFGIPFDEDFELPWTEKYEGDIDAWWLHEVIKFKPSVELYDSDGNYLNGVLPSDADINKYFEEQRAAIEANPLLVELVTHCSGEYPMYILAVKGSRTCANRGEVVSFDPQDLLIDQQGLGPLVKFCKDYGIEHDEPPKWLLTSFWG